ncbi:hypothetical protein BDR26DRAFT_888112 [Obelidium mucronatum]|nr:hypothetical protein BDR26DRAFT_888112 [Obelidium mucronatum]
MLASMFVPSKSIRNPSIYLPDQCLHPLLRTPDLSKLSNDSAWIRELDLLFSPESLEATRTPSSGDSQLEELLGSLTSQALASGEYQFNPITPPALTQDSLFDDFLMLSSTPSPTSPTSFSFPSSIHFCPTSIVPSHSKLPPSRSYSYPSPPAVSTIDCSPKPRVMIQVPDSNPHLPHGKYLVNGLLINSRPSSPLPTPPKRSSSLDSTQLLVKVPSQARQRASPSLGPIRHRHLHKQQGFHPFSK